MAFTPDDNHLFCSLAGGTLQFWDIHSGRLERSIPEEIELMTTRPIYSFNPIRSCELVYATTKYPAIPTADSTFGPGTVQVLHWLSSKTRIVASLRCKSFDRIAFNADGSIMAILMTLNYERVRTCIKFWRTTDWRAELTLYFPHGELGNFVFTHLTIVSEMVFHPSAEERLFVVLSNYFGVRMFRYTIDMDDQFSIVSDSRSSI